MARTLEPPPLSTDLIQSAAHPLMADAWVNWILLALIQAVQTTPATQSPILLTGIGAAIGTTALIPIASAGTYRVTWYLRVTQAASVSSSATVTITSTDGAPIAQSGAAVVGNTTTTVQGGSVIVRADGTGPISYAVAYASAGGTPMQFEFSIIVESLGP